jgi:hypothetical protein
MMLILIHVDIRKCFKSQPSDGSALQQSQYLVERLLFCFFSNFCLFIYLDSSNMNSPLRHLVNVCRTYDVFVLKELCKAMDVDNSISVRL